LPLGVVDADCRTEQIGIHLCGARQPCRHNADASSLYAIAGAAEWIGTVERVAQRIAGLVATVEKLKRTGSEQRDRR